MPPDRRWLAVAAGLLWLLLAARWAGWGWAVLYLAAGAAVGGAWRLAARLPAVWTPRGRPWLVVAAVHACLLGFLALAHAWTPTPVSALYASVAGGGAPAGGSTQHLRVTAHRLLQAKQWARAVQPLQELSGRVPLASAYVLLGQAKAEAGQVGTSPYTLDTARFLGARSTSLDAALGLWEMRAGGPHPAYLLLALDALRSAAADATPSQKAKYQRLAATAAARASQVFGTSPEPIAGGGAAGGR